MNRASKTTLGGRSFLVEVLNLPAPGKDQDAWRLSDGFVAVADGATPLGDEPPSAVRDFARAALDELAARRQESARRMVRAAIEAIRRLATRHSPPLSCTLALARTVPDGIQIVVLGDCTVVVADDQGRRRTIRDPRLSRIDGRVIATLADLTRAGVSAEDANRAIAEDLIANRMRMNLPDSYWSISSESAASRHILHRLLAPQSVSAMLLCSDGFARLADTFSAPAGMTSLLRRCQRDGLVALGEELRSLEQAPDSLVRYPRFGRHDDATAILLTASEAKTPG
jgi:hypothetical protein